MPSELLTERRGTTLVLSIRDPDGDDALSPQVFAAGVETLSVAEEDDGVRCIVIQADGLVSSAGGSPAALAERRQGDPAVQMEVIDRFHAFVEAVRSCPKPVIAAVEEAAAGDAFSLVLACDLVVAAEEARFVVAHGRLGLPPLGGASWHLARTLPRALALQLLWLAEPVTGRQLNALGLVNRMTATGGALAEALALAERLAAMTPGAVAQAKELVNDAGRETLQDQLQQERDLFLDGLFGRKK